MKSCCILRWCHSYFSRNVKYALLIVSIASGKMNTTSNNVETTLMKRKETRKHVSKIWRDLCVDSPAPSKQCCYINFSFFSNYYQSKHDVAWHRSVRKRVVMLDKAALLNSESILNWNVPAFLPVFSTTTTKVEHFKVFRVSLIILRHNEKDKKLFFDNWLFCINEL